MVPRSFATIAGKDFNVDEVMEFLAPINEIGILPFSCEKDKLSMELLQVMLSEGYISEIKVSKKEERDFQDKEFEFTKKVNEFAIDFYKQLGIFHQGHNTTEKIRVPTKLFDSTLMVCVPTNSYRHSIVHPTKKEVPVLIYSNRDTGMDMAKIRFGDPKKNYKEMDTMYSISHRPDRDDFSAKLAEKTKAGYKTYSGNYRATKSAYKSLQSLLLKHGITEDLYTQVLFIKEGK